MGVQEPKGEKNLRIVWKWKANLMDYVEKPGVVGVRIPVVFPHESSIFGRDGWVGFIEGDKKGEATEQSIQEKRKEGKV